MPTHKDIRIGIVADYEDAEECGMKVHNERLVTVHIPGEEGVEFCYEYQNRSTYDIIIQATFDGCKSKEVVHCAAGKDGYDAGPCTSATTLRAYRFRNVTTPESVDGMSDEELYNDSIGRLEFRVYRVRVTRFHSHIPHVNDTSSIKASLGSTVEMPVDHQWLPPPKEWVPIDDDKHPYVVFCFIYKPRAKLVELGLIPARTQSQSTKKAAKSRGHKPTRSSLRTSTSQKAKSSRSSASLGKSAPTPLHRWLERDFRVPSPGPSSIHSSQTKQDANLRPAGHPSVSVVKSEVARRGVSGQQPPDSESDSDDSTSDLEMCSAIADAESRHADAVERREAARLKALKLRVELERKKRASRHGARGEQSTQNKKRRLPARGGSVEPIDLTRE